MLRKKCGVPLFGAVKAVFVNYGEITKAAKSYGGLRFSEKTVVHPLSDLAESEFMAYGWTFMERPANPTITSALDYVPLRR